MKRSIPLILLLIVVFAACRQRHASPARPKIVVGLVVDQMRWDYLYRYYKSYGHGGFKRLLREGYNCQNTLINYLPTYTAPGHASMYTGSVPSINGIAGNFWIDDNTGKQVYCVTDKTVWIPGDTSKAASCSPANLLTTTITDELRLATNFRSRVFGVALKDRSAILPAGHAANAAYWFNDKTGDFVTSTYYDTAYQQPKWLRNFNKRNLADSLVKLNWTLLQNVTDYTESAADKSACEEAFTGEEDPVFPHKFDLRSKADRVPAIKSIPAGNYFTFQMAKACMKGEKVGKGKETDFMCISLSATDYAAHQFGPNSLELEDMYIRLDKDIAAFLDYMDREYGKDNYLFFLSADHGGAHSPQYLKDRKIPAGLCYNLAAELNVYLREQFSTDANLVNSILNYQVNLNDTLLDRYQATDRENIKTSIQNWLLHTMPTRYSIPVAYVLDMENPAKWNVPEPIRTMAINGYHRQRSGALQIILNPGWLEGEHPKGTTHGSWNPYDAHIPLIWYGWHIPQGESFAPVNMTDISPTLAALLHIQMPSGCIGKPIEMAAKGN